MIILAVDLGHKRTGIAVSDRTELLASSLGVIEEPNDHKLVRKIAEQATETHAERIVVGLPKNMDGTEGEAAQRARALADEIGRVTGLSVVMQDERGTTLTAHEVLSDGGVYGRKRKQRVDAVAASIILQNYLDSRRS